MKGQLLATKPSSTRLGFNVGAMVMHSANTYPSIADVLLEIVQNALDEEATTVSVVVDYKADFISVRDNGRGTTVEHFNEALATVATPGRKERGSLGQFGLGLISPIGKCRKAIFTSCPDSSRDQYCSWVFETEKIRKESLDLQIPIKHRKDLVFGKSESQRQIEIDWRSEMRLEGIVPDKTIRHVDMDRLVEEILGRFGVKMRRNKVALSIRIVDEDGREKKRDNVTAVDFLGQPLDPVRYKTEAAGNVRFQLYLARLTVSGTKGKVLVGVEGDSFTFPFHYFARAVTGMIDQDTLNTLKSGMFEGVITGQKLKLHPSRQSFEKNDAFIEFCTAIERWWKEYGSGYAKAAEEAVKDNRLQRLGLESMKHLSQMLRDSRYGHLLDAIKSFARGTIGGGHTPRPRNWEKGSQGHNSLTTVAPPYSSDGTKGGREHQPPMKAKEEHHPLSVAGPQGQRRVIVRDDSFGLQFAHEQMEGSSDLWKLNSDEGLLIFNIRHPLWVECDEKGDRHVMRLQEVIAIQALTLLTLPESQRIYQRAAFNALNETLVPWMLADQRR